MMPAQDDRGVGNIIAGGDVKDNEISINNTINNILVQSVDYNKWQEDIQKDELLLTYLPVDDPKRESLTTEIEELKKKMASFEQLAFNIVRRLSEIQIGSERFEKARKFIEEGKIAEAQEVLDEKQINKEGEKLKAALKEKESSIEEDKKKLRHLAEQLLTKAELEMLMYEKTDRLEMADRYYKASIDMMKYLSNLESYADYLSSQGRKKEEAEIYEALLKLGDEVPKITQVRVLHNLAICHSDDEDTDKAMEYFDRMNAIREFSDSIDEVLSVILAVGTLINSLLQKVGKSDTVDFLIVEKLDTLNNVRSQVVPDANLQALLMPLTAKTLFEISEALIDKGEVEKGLEYYHRSFDIVKAFVDKQVYPPIFPPKDLTLGLVQCLSRLHAQKAIEKAELVKLANETIELNIQYEKLVREKETEKGKRMLMMLSISIAFSQCAEICDERVFELLKRAFAESYEVELSPGVANYFYSLYLSLVDLNPEEDEEYLFEASTAVRRFFPYINWQDADSIAYRDSINKMVELELEKRRIEAENKEQS